MQQITFETAGEHGRKQRHGWQIPDTGGLLAVDQRFPGPDCDADEIVAEDAYDFVIIHLPTGFMVCYGCYTEARTLPRAAGIAQAFYRECQRLGVDLNTAEANRIIAPVNALPKEDRLRFWERIQASEDYLELESHFATCPNADEHRR